MLPKEKRQFFRHPISVPIQLQISRGRDLFISESTDISLGGLSFFWPAKLSRGSRISLSIPVKEKMFEIKARVVYSREHRKTQAYRIGVSFTDSPSAFKAKLAEEALEIMEYRKKLSSTLGYELSEEEAARRWISEYAAKFPRIL